jgi:ParB-like chromosome segregation protein Spo0J
MRPRTFMKNVVRMLRQRYEPEQLLSVLKPFPGNPKDHDQGAIAESIDELGFFGAILAQEETEFVLAGHGRLADLLRRGATFGPVLWVRCSAEVARSIVLADNRISERGGWNDQALGSYFAHHFKGMHPDALRGTGFDVEDVQELASRLEPLDFRRELRIRIANPHHSAAIARAIEILLAKHPEWRARLDAA